MNKAAALAAALAAMSAAAASPLDDALDARVRAFARDAAAAASTPSARVEIEVGTLDPRLKLAPCDDVRPQLPANTRPWGAIRIALRCAGGPVHWQVYLPLTVRVFAPSLVAAAPLAAGTVLRPGDLALAEVDLAAAPGVALSRAELAVGRALARPLAAGTALREPHLRPRQWFDAGDTVRIVAGGTGYAVSGEGQALGPGIEGRPVRVRTGSGRIVSGQPVADRRVEVAL